jgi:hypothetical protein
VIAGAGVRSGVIAPDVFLLAEDKVEPAFPGTDQLDFPVQLDRIPATVVNDYYLHRRCRLGQNTGHCLTHKMGGVVDGDDHTDGVLASHVSPRPHGRSVPGWVGREVSSAILGGSRARRCSKMSHCQLRLRTSILIAVVNQTPAFYFDADQLEGLAQENAETFRAGTPFRHLVLDQFLPSEIFSQVKDSFPGVDQIPWTFWGPGMTKAEKVTGFERLVPDPSYRGCGLHSTGRGGRLMIHTDTNRHPHGNDVHQILNLILYLNEDWKEEYGGHLELWTKDRKPCRKILPVANRLVLFHTGTRSFHGHPEPVACPEGRRRNSLALYYYTRHRPLDDDYDGMQRAVRWVSTSDDDREMAGALVSQARAVLRQINGEPVALQAKLWPWALGDDKNVSMEPFLWDALEPARRERLQERLRPLEPFGSDYLPFAAFSARAGADLLDPDTVLALLGPESDVHLLRPGSRTLRFLCYFRKLLDHIVPR